MKRSTYLLLGLLVAMLVIVYFVKRQPGDEEATYTVSDIQMSLNPARVVKVEIEYQKKYVRLERLQGAWKITEPIHYAADDAAVSQLLDGMGRFKIIGLVSSNPEKQRVFQVNELGTSVVITNDDGKKAELVIGKADPSSNGAYIRPTSSTSVYISQGITPAMINRELNAWRKHTIMTVDPNSIQQLTLTSRETTVVLKKKGQRWYSGERPVGSDYINPLVQACTNIQSENFVDTSLIISRAPAYRIDIHGEQPYRLDMYPTSSSIQYFLKTSTAATIFVVNTVIANQAERVLQLLIPPEPSITEQETQQQIVGETQSGQKPQGDEKNQTVQSPWSKNKQTTEEKTQMPVTQQENDTKPVKTQKEPPPKQIVKESPPPKMSPSKSQTTSTPKSDSEGELIAHTVIKGETLQSIAQKYNVSVEDLMKWNLLKRPSIKPGMDLYVFVIKK